MASECTQQKRHSKCTAITPMVQARVVLTLCCALIVLVNFHRKGVCGAATAVLSDRVKSVNRATLSSECSRWGRNRRVRGSLPDRRTLNGHFLSVTFAYEAGVVEKYWSDVAKDPTVDSCEIYKATTMKEASTAAWMEAVHDMSSLPFMSPVPNSTLLSRFQYTGKRADGKQVTWSEWIEPLAGMTRNPFALCVNVADVPRRFHQKIGKRMDLDFLLLQKQQSFSMNQEKNTRRFLFDLGGSYFMSSLHRLICKYFVEGGISFDELYVWEAHNMEPVGYWQEVPALWMPKMHFFNIPIPANPADPKSPLSVIRAVVQPSDFLALKLDIDNTSIELAYLLFILEHQEICRLVDEMFFEYHYESGIMSQHGWGHTGQGNLSHALSLFQATRKCGIRLHFWP